MMPRTKLKWLSYEDASEWARTQNIKTCEEWRHRLKNDLYFQPQAAGVPRAPQIVYQPFFREQGGWAAFLGTTVNRRVVPWASLSDASVWAKTHKFINKTEWFKHCHHDPEFDPDALNIPINPLITYGEIEFLKIGGWAGFLGCKPQRSLNPPSKKWLSIEAASAWAKNQKIDNGLAWLERCKSDTNFLAQGVPMDPRRSYGGISFMNIGGWTGFLGITRTKTLEQWTSLEEASAWAQQQGIFSKKSWDWRCKNDESFSDERKRLNIPSMPGKIYRLSSCGGWGAFLGTGKVAFKSLSFLPIQEAAKWAAQLNLSGSEEWHQRRKDTPALFPKNIPSNPASSYKNFAKLGGWPWFLGSGRPLRIKPDQMCSYEEARQWAMSNGIFSTTDWRTRLSDSTKRPSHIHPNPQEFYADFYERGGWNYFFNHSKLAGVSKIEKAVVVFLREIFEVDESGPYKILTTNNGVSKKISGDFVDSKRRFVFEYDGRHYHKNPSRDIQKTIRLTREDPPWIVIRAREAGLPLLNETLDVIVDPVSDGQFTKRIETILRHIHHLVQSGILPADDAVNAKLHAAYSHGIDTSRYANIFEHGWRSLEKASEWAKKNKFRHRKDYLYRCRTTSFLKPSDIPMNPDIIYGDSFSALGWHGYLGTLPRASFEESAAWAQQQGLKTGVEWRRFARQKPRVIPENMPINPNAVFPEFKEKGGFSFFLTGRKPLK